MKRRPFLNNQMGVGLVGHRLRTKCEEGKPWRGRTLRAPAPTCRRLRGRGLGSPRMPKRKATLRAASPTFAEPAVTCQASPTPALAWPALLGHDGGLRGRMPKAQLKPNLHERVHVLAESERHWGADMFFYGLSIWAVQAITPRLPNYRFACREPGKTSSSQRS